MQVSLCPIVNRFLDFFGSAKITTSQPFLLAVSGGVDSVVLCELCRQAGFIFDIAHCNFGLRGEESERDEAFVKSLGGKYGVEVYVQTFDTEDYATEHKLSIQEAARKLRYNWFEMVQKEKGYSYTLLAHHANDTIETVLMNFFRGTGVEGLTGIPVFSPFGKCMRPMLLFKREEILAFAQAHKLDWVEDSSNDSNKYTRNFFRNELIPQLKTVYPKVEDNLLNNSHRFNRINLLYKKLVADLKQKLCKYGKDEVRIPVKQLMEYAPTSLIYEIIKDYHFNEKQVDEVIKLAGSESGKYIDNGEFRIIKHKAWFIITKSRTEGATIVIDRQEKQVRFEYGVIDLKEIKADKTNIPANDSMAMLDAAEIAFPLLLRKWKQGDYFYPLGMRKKKKVARFLIDQKVPRHHKETVYVLESNRKIIWVVGMRIDDRFKVTEKTKKILSLAHKG